MCIERTSSQTHKWLPWYAFLDVENPDLQTGENIPLKKKYETLSMRMNCNFMCRHLRIEKQSQVSGNISKG